LSKRAQLLRKKSKTSIKLITSKNFCKLTLSSRSFNRFFGLSRWSLRKMFQTSGLPMASFLLLFNLNFSNKFSFRSGLKTKNKFILNLLGSVQLPISREVKLQPRLLKNKQTNNLKSRIDVFLRLLLPTVFFFSLKKTHKTVLFNFYSFLFWPVVFLDLLAIIIFSNPIFLNVQFFDLSAFINSSLANKLTLYYTFKIPLFATWLVVFLPLTSSNVVAPSLEILFKSLAWAEREVSELFGFYFFFKKNNRKLITDYFFKINPLLKWVPSIGFSEVYLSSEGFFKNRSIKVFNASLS
jgi:ribosomal protein S14